MSTMRLLDRHLKTALLFVWLAVIAAKLSYDQWRIYESRSEISTRSVPNWRTSLSNRVPSVGRADAPIVVMEFFDYQCPFCRELEPRLERFVASHPDIAFYRFDLPLTDIHPYALPAAIATRCAGAQGAGTDYGTQIFRQPGIDAINWVELARVSRVPDIKRFASCVNSQQTIGEVNSDVDKGRSFGITQTPTLIVNGMLASGAPSERQLTRLYDEARKGKAIR